MSSSTETPLLLEQGSENVKSRIPRVRSSAYPSYNIEFCADFTKKIHQTFGNSSFNQREEISKVLKISISHIQTQLSSAAQYGLIEMKVKVGYKPSELFLRVYKPMNDDEKREALIDCLLHPELYKKLLLQFQSGIVPSVSALSTILFRSHNIAEGASENAAQIFIDNLNSLQLLDQDNHLLLDRHIEEEAIEQSKVSNNEEVKRRPNAWIRGLIQKSKDVELPKISVPINEQTNTYPILIPLKNNRAAKLILPVDFKEEDLDKITKFIEALRE